MFTVYIASDTEVTRNFYNLETYMCEYMLVNHDVEARFWLSLSGDCDASQSEVRVHNPSYLT